MKEQKRLIYLFGLTEIFSLIVSIALELELDRTFIVWQRSYFIGHRDFIINFLMGICTGAFLAFLTASINYLSERTSFLTEFLEICEDFCAALHQLKYLYFEANANSWARYYNEANSDKNIRGSAYNELLNWYKSKYPESNAEGLLERRRQEINKNLSSVEKNYYKFIGFNFCVFERVMKKGSFILCHNKQKKRIDEIYLYIKKTYEDTTSIVEYMKEFNASNNLILQIDKLQSQIFGEVQHSGSVVFLPPTNEVEKYIKDLLKELNYSGGKENVKPTTRINMGWKR